MHIIYQGLQNGKRVKYSSPMNAPMPTGGSEERSRKDSTDAEMPKEFYDTIDRSNGNTQDEHISDEQRNVSPPDTIAVAAVEELPCQPDTARTLSPPRRWLELSDEKKAAIVKQVEFYFSDENLPTDKFMKQKIEAGGTQGWVPVQVIANFNKMKKMCKDVRAIAEALERSEALVVDRKGGEQYRVRRKVPFKFPDKDMMSDITSRTVLAVNIPPDSTVESLQRLFERCGAVETIRIIHKNDPKKKDLQMPVGASRDFYATCQYSKVGEAIKAVTELTDRKSWRGGLRVTLANGMTVEKANNKLKMKKTKQERGDNSFHGSVESKGSKNCREGQSRSRSLTELELIKETGEGKQSTSSGHGEHGSNGDSGHRVRNNGSADGVTSKRKPRSESNVDSAYGTEEMASPTRNETGLADKVPLKGIVQTVTTDGWSWIKRDGGGSRKSGSRVPFSKDDVVTKEGEASQPLQKGDHVQYLTWRNKEGTLMAVRIEKLKDRGRPGGAGAAGGGQWRTDRATQAHFRMARGPAEGSNGFGAGRGKPIEEPARSHKIDSVTVALENDEAIDAAGVIISRRTRGSSMGGPESKEFVPGPGQFENAI